MAHLCVGPLIWFGVGIYVVHVGWLSYQCMRIAGVCLIFVCVHASFVVICNIVIYVYMRDTFGVVTYVYV